jgi:hypothetical protein
MIKISGLQNRNLRIFRHLCGERDMSSVFLVMTRWEHLGQEEQAKLEKEMTDEDGFWGPMAALGSPVVRYQNDRDSAMNVIIEAIYHRPLGPAVLQTQEEMVDQELELSQTSAGAVFALLAEYTTAVDDGLYLE